MSYREYNKKYENLFEFIEGDEFNKWRHNIGHNTGHREDELKQWVGHSASSVFIESLYLEG